MESINEFLRLFPEMELQNPEYIRILNECAITRSSVIFAMTARVGSTGLTSILHKNMGFNFIEEIFNGRGVADNLINKNGIKTFFEYMKFINEYHASKVFSFKTCWADFEFLAAGNLYKTLFPNSRFVFLDRVDIEAQAVSLFAASKTGLWHRQKNADFDYPEHVSLDRDDIDRCLWQLFQEKLMWCAFFQDNTIMPLTLIYEMINGDPSAAVEAIFKYASLPTPQSTSWEAGDTEKINAPANFELLRQYRNARYPNLGLGPKIDV
jgi:hypothetical protein